MRHWLKFYRLSDATFYDHINTIYQFMKPFLDKKKKSILEEYGAFKNTRNYDQVCFTTSHYPSPNHYTTSTKSVPL